MHIKENEKDFLLSSDPNKQIPEFLSNTCSKPNVDLSPEKLKYFLDFGSEKIFLKKESHCKVFFSLSAWRLRSIHWAGSLLGRERRLTSSSGRSLCAYRMLLTLSVKNVCSELVFAFYFYVGAPLQK